MYSVDTAARTNAKSFVVKVRGKNPEHAVFTPDGRFVFVSAEDGEAVDVIDVAKRAQVGQIPVGARPRGIAFSADSKRAYVAAENANEVYVIDAQAFVAITSAAICCRRTLASVCICRAFGREATGWLG